ncbi:hypothetical protein [uncultured Chitinophaga sp.]|uniref:hypothetical protein n=1 Tax=uncultured Chitinophaga sp. TaxID=339340 RepID=UPI0025FF5EEF|nr:hypothetical protein [uncultured Chitinophaga sp.]
MRKNLLKKIEGTIAGQTLIKSGDGVKARRQRGISAERIQNDAAFQGTREVNSNFTAAAKAGMALRDSFNEATSHLNDKKLSNRLNSLMRVILKTDVTNAPGLRTVASGDLSLLNGFQLNSRCKPGSSLRKDHVATIDRVTGEAKVLIPSFEPLGNVYGPSGSTHFVLVLAASAVDFETGKSQKALVKSQAFPISMGQTGDIELTALLPADSELPLFAAFGIYFVEIIGDMTRVCRNGAFNEMAIVAVDAE